MNTLRFLATVLAGLIGLCGVSISAPAFGRDDVAAYYIVTHPDLRKCAYPMCGGYFVKAVNRARTRCADGEWRSECRVIELDTKALELTDEEKATFEKIYYQGLGLVRGSLIAQPGPVIPLPTLVAKEAWSGQAQSEPEGTFYHVVNTGIVCITDPCPSFQETRLNTTGMGQMISAVDLAASGAGKEEVEAGYKAMDNSGILIAGKHRAVTGPAGSSLALVASEFYLPFLHGEGEPCGGNICGVGEYCCNASCGMCAAIGTGCIQMVCE